MTDLKKTYQVGWNQPGNVYQADTQEDAFEFAGKLLDAGAAMVVINPNIELDQPVDIHPTPIGG